MPNSPNSSSPGPFSPARKPFVDQKTKYVKNRHGKRSESFDRDPKINREPGSRLSGQSLEGQIRNSTNIKSEEPENGPNLPISKLSIDELRSNVLASPEQHRKRSAQDEGIRPLKIRSADISSRHIPSSPPSVKTQSQSADCRSSPPVPSPKIRSPGLDSKALRQSLYTASHSKHGQKWPQDAHLNSADQASEHEAEIFLQPDTRPISQEQLINEVKGIYAGLVMVEKKCVEICQQQAQTTNKLTDEQWQALIALHRTLLHEHHDFFLASQHPTAAAALRRLPQKYAMPARMWRHGIHSFLELLRHRLPHSLEHMLSFVYLAYQMMGLLLESVPAFHETWIECLGDLARYRMAIEEADMRDRETWSNVARTWYNRAADRSPDTGRIQHHLAVLARPNIVRQLFYYSKALISVLPFINARESIMLLFSPFLEKPETAMSKYLIVESCLVLAAGLAFTQGSISNYLDNMAQVTAGLDNHITMCGPEFKVQGAEMASSLVALILCFGFDDCYLWNAFRKNTETIKIRHQEKNGEANNSQTVLEESQIAEEIRAEYWTAMSSHTPKLKQAELPTGDRRDAVFSSHDEVTSYVLPDWHNIVSVVAAKVGDRNALPFLHVTLAAIWSFSYVPGFLPYIEKYVPWAKIVLSLNTLSRSGISDSRVEAKEFPQQQSATGRHLPEDFNMRGLVWAPFYYPTGFFQGQMVDEDERLLELPSHAAPRSERCLWLGARIASLNRYISYNTQTKKFAVMEFALSLADEAVMNTLKHLPPSGIAL